MVKNVTMVEYFGTNCIMFCQQYTFYTVKNKTIHTPGKYWFNVNFLLTNMFENDTTTWLKVVR